MTTYSPAFIAAFNETMKFEVGPWFNPADPDVISGAYSTPLQRRKVGYVDIDGDSGSLTKYGIASASNPSADVKNLTLAGAMDIYYRQYWQLGLCLQITIPITTFHFDSCVNNGVPRAAKMLQQAVGVTQDGQIGPQTLAMVNKQDPRELINKLAAIRIARYHIIVQNNPTQAKFLDGWLSRVTAVQQFSLSQV